MRIEYERACKQAGLPEEKIREIRQLFDADYKMLKRQNDFIHREEIIFLSLELLLVPEGDPAPYYIMDPESDVERIVLHRLDLEKLNRVLNRITEKDKEFILDCFDDEWGARKKIAEKYGMTIGAVDQKKRRILEKLQMLFFEDGTNPISFK